MARWPIWSQEGRNHTFGSLWYWSYSGVHFDSTQYPSNSVARMVQLGYSSVLQLSDFETQSGIRPYLHHQDLSSTALKTFCCSSLQSVFLWICLVHPLHQHTGPWCQILVLTHWTCGHNMPEWSIWFGVHNRPILRHHGNLTINTYPIRVVPK